MTLQETINQAIPRFNARPLFSTKRDIQLFVDRNEELEELEKAIRHGFNALLLGERGSGKTSILNALAYKLENSKEGITAVHMSAMIYSIDKPSSLLQTLLTELIKKVDQRPKRMSERIKKILEQLAGDFPQTIGQTYMPLSLTASRKKEENGKSPDSFEMLNSRYELAEKFGEIIRELETKEKIKIVFLIDDSDKNAQGFYRAASQLRELLWRSQASYIVSGDVNQENEYKRPPLDAFFDKTVYIKPITTELGEKILRSRLESNIGGKKDNELFSKELMNSLVKSSHGNVRQFLKYARDVLENAVNLEWPGKRIDVSILDYLKRGSELSAKAIQELTERDREVLTYLRSYGPVSASDEAFQLAMGVQRSRLVQILKRLEQRGLTKSQRTKGQKHEKLYTAVPLPIELP